MFGKGFCDGVENAAYLNYVVHNRLWMVLDNMETGMHYLRAQKTVVFNCPWARK